MATAPTVRAISAVGRTRSSIRLLIASTLVAQPPTDPAGDMRCLSRPSLPTDALRRATSAAMRASCAIVWLNAAAISPSVSPQSVGRRCEKSPSRKAVIATKIWRARDSGESATAGGRLRGGVMRSARLRVPLTDAVVAREYEFAPICHPKVEVAEDHPREVINLPVARCVRRNSPKKIIVADRFRFACRTAPTRAAPRSSGDGVARRDFDRRGAAQRCRAAQKSLTLSSARDRSFNSTWYEDQPGLPGDLFQEPLMPSGTCQCTVLPLRPTVTVRSKTRP